MTCAKTYFILSVSSTGVVSQFWHCKAWPVMLTVSAAVTDILCELVCENLHSYTKFSLAGN